MPHPSHAASIIIKRYARSRLYDAAGGRYVSIETLRTWVAHAIAFKVMDVETGDDVTSVLLA